MVDCLNPPFGVLCSRFEPTSGVRWGQQWTWLVHEGEGLAFFWVVTVPYR